MANTIVPGGEEAHARDLDRTMKIVAQHVDPKRVVAHWHEMYPELSEQGNADMQELTGDRTMVLIE